MAASVNADIPTQGVTGDSWFRIFLDDSGQPRFFTRSTSPDAIINNLINGLLALATITAILYFAYAAWLLVTSIGNPDKYTQAKNTLLNACVGVIVLVAMWLLIFAVRTLARGTI